MFLFSSQLEKKGGTAQLAGKKIKCSNMFISLIFIQYRPCPIQKSTFSSEKQLIGCSLKIPDEMHGYFVDRPFYYITKLNQAFSLVDSTVQYFPSYCTLQKLNQIAWKPECNKRNTTLRCRTKQCIALSLVKPVNSPCGFVHQVWPASRNTLLRSAPSCSIPIMLHSNETVRDFNGSKQERNDHYWIKNKNFMRF